MRFDIRSKLWPRMIGNGNEGINLEWTEEGINSASSNDASSSGVLMGSVMIESRQCSKYLAASEPA